MTLQDRLDKAALAGALSGADLALWFDLSYQTVRAYRVGTVPFTARAALIEQRLKWLENAVKTDPHLPVPLSVRARDRKKYILGVLNRARRGK